MLTTRPYYETHAGELTAREPEIVLMAGLVHRPIDFKVRLGFRLPAKILLGTGIMLGVSLILLMQRFAARN